LRQTKGLYCNKDQLQVAHHLNKFIFMTAKIENKIEKRKRISKEEALSLLDEYHQDLFQAYWDGIDKYNIEINQTIPEARVRLNSVLLNAKLTESFILHFPDRWSAGKYGRIIFRWEGLSMLIKKLNKNGKPSYIPTLLSESIVSQLQQPLFEDDSFKEDAILIFGYTKDKDGQIVNPRIVYYDNAPIWIIDKNDIISKPASHGTLADSVDVKLKEQKDEKKKAE
jgi:hypothetical protein